MWVSSSPRQRPPSPARKSRLRGCPGSILLLLHRCCCLCSPQLRGSLCRDKPQSKAPVTISRPALGSCCLKCVSVSALKCGFCAERCSMERQLRTAVPHGAPATWLCLHTGKHSVKASAAAPHHAACFLSNASVKRHQITRKDTADRSEPNTKFTQRDAADRPESRHCFKERQPSPRIPFQLLQQIHIVPKVVQQQIAGVGAE